MALGFAPLVRVIEALSRLLSTATPGIAIDFSAPVRPAAIDQLWGVPLLTVTDWTTACAVAARRVMS